MANRLDSREFHRIVSTNYSDSDRVANQKLMNFSVSKIGIITNVTNDTMYDVKDAQSDASWRNVTAVNHYYSASIGVKLPALEIGEMVMLVFLDYDASSTIEMRKSAIPIDKGNHVHPVITAVVAEVARVLVSYIELTKEQIHLKSKNIAIDADDNINITAAKDTTISAQTATIDTTQSTTIKGNSIALDGAKVTLGMAATNGALAAAIPMAGFITIPSKAIANEPCTITITNGSPTVLISIV